MPVAMTSGSSGVMAFSSSSSFHCGRNMLVLIIPPGIAALMVIFCSWRAGAMPITQLFTADFDME